MPSPDDPHEDVERQFEAAQRRYFAARVRAYHAHVKLLTESSDLTDAIATLAEVSSADLDDTYEEGVLMLQAFDRGMALGEYLETEDLAAWLTRRELDEHPAR